MALTEDALNRAQIHRFLGGDPASTIKAIKAVDVAELKSLVEQVMMEKNCHFV